MHVFRFNKVVEIRVVPPLCPVMISPFDFSRTAELIDRSAASTRQWLDEGGLGESALPHQLPPHSHRA
jgi:NTE family protein